MSKEHHRFVAFWFDAWTGGTSRMSRMQRSVYFDVCLYCWDKVEPVPAGELPLMFGDIENWAETLDILIAAEKLFRTPDGSVGNSRALKEGNFAFEQWKKKSSGGKLGASRRRRRTPDGSGNGTPNRTPDGSAEAPHQGMINIHEMKGTEKNLATLDSRAGARALVDVADWISTESWEGYEAMRVTLGKPMTDHVRKLTIEQLAELRDQGQDPNAVLDQSTLHGWISLIAVKPNGNGTPPASKPETPDEYWERRMCDYDRYGNWLSFDGPPPGQHGCRVPQGILDAHAQRASAHGRQAPRTGG